MNRCGSFPLLSAPHSLFRIWTNLKRSEKIPGAPKGRSSIANSGTWVAVLLGMNRCGSFPLLSAPHSLCSIWTNLKRSEKIPGAPTRRWGERIWLTEPTGLHRNSPQGLNINSIRVLTRSESRESQSPFVPTLPILMNNYTPIRKENPEKTSPRKLVPTRDRTRAPCVTSAHATTCSTAVDLAG